MFSSTPPPVTATEVGGSQLRKWGVFFKVFFQKKKQAHLSPPPLPPVSIDDLRIWSTIRRQDLFEKELERKLCSDWGNEAILDQTGALSSYTTVDPSLLLNPTDLYASFNFEDMPEEPPTPVKLWFDEPLYQNASNTNATLYVGGPFSTYSSYSTYCSLFLKLFPVSPTFMVSGRNIHL